MTYRVIITDPAFEAIEAQADYIAIEQQAPLAAAKWLRRILEAGADLSEMPYREPKALEDAYRSYEVRWTGIGEFVLLYTVVEETKTVWVIGARHGRQRPRPEALPSDLDSLP